MAPVHQNGRLLFVAPSAYPLGGVAVWLDYLVPGLTRLGWSPLIALPDGDHHRFDVYRDRYPDLPLIRFSNPSGSQEGRVRSLTRLIREHDPRLVISVNIPDVYRAVARLDSGQRERLRCAMALHAIQEDLLLDIGYYSAVIDAVITTNRLAEALVANTGSMEKHRVHYAPYGVHVPPRSASSPHGSDALTIAFVGRFDERQKRLSDFAAIVGKLAQRNIGQTLIIAGDGPDKSTFLKLLEEAGADRIEYLGILSAEELAQRVYRRADALLLTSAWETGPIVAWEAMAHGLVVVSSKYIGSAAERALADEQNCLLFDRGDIPGAADKLQSLFDREKRVRLARNGRRLIRQRYSRSVSISTWSQVFEDILSQPPRTAPAARYPSPPQGRLDQLLGTRAAESVRQFLGIRFRHIDAGGEWPHSHHRPRDHKAFLELARELDEAN